jgi:hypothetical protein
METNEIGKGYHNKHAEIIPGTNAGTTEATPSLQHRNSA